MATLQSQACQNANGLISIGQQLVGMKSAIDTLSAQYTQLTLGSVLGAFKTCKVNPDGTTGTTDEGAPVPGNVIDRTVAGQSELTRDISMNDIGALLGTLQEVSKLLAGGPIAQQGQSPQILAKITGGAS